MMYDRISEGQEFIPSAQRENAVNDLLNRFNSPGGVPDRNTYSSRLVTVPVKLAHAESIAAGELIGFLFFKDDYAQSIAPESWESSGARLGIVRSAMKKNEIADVAVLGAVPGMVEISKVSEHGYAKPDQSGKLISCKEMTQFQIISATGELRSGERQLCRVFISSPPTKPETYHGPFSVSLNKDGTKVIISPGYLNRNGKMTEVPEKTIAWNTGYLCIHSEINGSTWTTPEFRIVSVPTATEYPVAYLSGSDEEGKWIEQYHVPMAFIILSMECPVATGK